MLRRTIAPIGLTIAFAFSLLWPPAPARAAIIVEALEGIVVGGPFAGTVGNGSFTYDDSLIFGSGSEFIGPLDGLAVEFTIFGQLFTELDDIAFPGYPELSLFDGEPESLDFIVYELDPNNPTPITDPGVLGFDMFDIIRQTNGSFLAEVEVLAATIPILAALPLLLAGLASLGLIGRRGRKAASA